MRTLTSAMNTALVQPVVHFLYLVRLDFDEGTVAWHNGHRSISYDGATYVGTGVLGSVSAVQEEPGINSASVTVSLSGVKPEIVSLLLGQQYLNRPASIHLALVDEALTFDADKCIKIFSGSMDNIEGTIGQSASFSVSLRSRLADWERMRTVRYTDAEQQKLHPGDLGMEYIPQISQAKIIWPRAAYLPDPRD